MGDVIEHESVGVEQDYLPAVDELDGASKSIVSAERPYTDLIAVAINKGVDVTQLERLMELEDRWDKKNARKSYYRDMASLQAELRPVEKKGHVVYEHRQDPNKSTNYFHGRLEDAVEALRPLLQKYGFSYRFEKTEDTSAGNFSQMLITVRCIVTHRDGHEESNVMSGYPDSSGQKNAIQQAASTDSYLRRYTLTGAFGLVFKGEDDDAGGPGIPAERDNQVEGDYCPQEQFEKLLPVMRTAIQDRGESAARSIGFMESKGLKPSPEQVNILNSLEAQK